LFWVYLLFIFWHILAFKCQFHQHFTRAFLADKNFKPKTQLCNFWRKNIGAKCARKMLIKSTQVYKVEVVSKKNLNEMAIFNF